MNAVDIRMDLQGNPEGYPVGVAEIIIEGDVGVIEPIHIEHKPDTGRKAPFIPAQLIAPSESK